MITKEDSEHMSLMKKLTSGMVAASLVFGLVGTAFADYSQSSVSAAANRMRNLGIVKGTVLADGSVDLALNENITRAQLVTIIVRAFGQGETAALLKGAPVFSDSASHWASGEIAIAKNIIEHNGYTLGVTANTFQPDSNVTTAQAVAFVMKFLGVKAAAGLSWPMDYIQGAVDAGIIAGADKDTLVTMPNSPANRGLVFYLADKAFGSYKLENGKTMYSTYVDTTAPDLTVADVKATTEEASVTVSGSVKGQKALYVGSLDNAVTPDASGNFTATVALKVGENKILVHAVDEAGNVTEKNVTVTRNTGAAATIEAADITVAAGAAADVAATVKDKAGNAIANAAVTGDAGTLGTFADGKFTAGKTAGTGTLTLKSGDATVAVKVTVTAGALDKVVADKNNVAPGAMVTLSAQDANGNTIASGVTYSQTSADAMIDGTNGKFLASKAGNYTVTATANGVSKTVTIGVYDTTLSKYAVAVSADNVIANQASTIDVTVKATDANGNVITTNTDTVTVQSAAFEYKKADGTYASLAGGVAFTLKDGAKTLTVRTLNGQLGGIVAKVFAGPVGSTQGNASVTLADQVATSLSVANSDTFLSSSATANATTFTVKVLDQAGKDMKTGTYSIATSIGSATYATVNGGDTTSSKTVTYSNGTAATVTVNPVQFAAGKVSFTATASGLSAASKDVTVQMPSVASQVLVSADTDNKASNTANVDSVKYTVKVADAAGVPLTGVNPTTVKVNFPDLTSDNWAQIQVKDNKVGVPAFAALGSNNSAALTFVNGVAEFEVKTVKYTGQLNFQVKDTATSSALAFPGAVSANFVGGEVAGIGFSVNGSANKAAVTVGSGTPNLTVVAQAYDAAGNKTTLTDGKYRLVGTGANGGVDADVKINGVDNDEKVSADANGAATFNVVLGNYVNATYTLNLTLDYTNGAGAAITNFATGVAGQVRSTTATVANSQAANIAIAMYSDAGRTMPLSTVTADGDVFVTATVTDAAGRKLAGEVLTFAIPDGDKTSKFASNTPVITDNNDGTYTFAIKPQSAPSAAFVLSTTKAATTVKANGTVGVRPGTTPTGIKLARTSTDNTVNLTTGTVTAYTVNLVDNFGNTVVNNLGADQNITIDLAGITAGKLVQVRKAADGLAVSTQAAGATTATATVTVTQGNAGVTIYLVTDQAAGTTFTLTANDGAGPLTDDAAVTVNVK